MIKNFDDFLSESVSEYKWLSAPLMKFVKETDVVVKKETDGMLSIITSSNRSEPSSTNSQFGINTEGSKKLFNMGNSHDDYLMYKIMRDGWFSLGLSIKKQFMAEMLSVFYKLEGFKFVPYSFYKKEIPSSKIDEWNANYMKEQLGNDTYLAIRAIREGRLPTKITAKNRAIVLNDMIKKLPVLDLEPFKTKITSAKYGI